MKTAEKLSKSEANTLANAMKKAKKELGLRGKIKRP
jgi:hypothetical protein